MKKRLITTVFLFIISCFYQTELFSASDELIPIPKTPRSCDLQKLETIHKLIELAIAENLKSSSYSLSDPENDIIPERLFEAYLGYFIERLEFKITNGRGLEDEIGDFFPHIVGRHEEIQSYKFVKKMELFLKEKLDRTHKENYPCEYFDISLNIFRHILRTEKQDDYLRNSHTLPRVLMIGMQQSLELMEFNFSDYKVATVLKTISKNLDRDYVLSHHLDLFKIYYIAFKDYQERFGMSQEEKTKALMLIVNIWFVSYVSPILVNKHHKSVLAREIQGLFSTTGEGSWEIRPKREIKKLRKEITDHFLEILENVRYSYY